MKFYSSSLYRMLLCFVLYEIIPNLILDMEIQVSWLPFQLFSRFILLIIIFTNYYQSRVVRFNFDSQSPLISRFQQLSKKRKKDFLSKKSLFPHIFTNSSIAISIVLRHINHRIDGRQRYVSTGWTMEWRYREISKRLQARVGKINTRRPIE